MSKLFAEIIIKNEPNEKKKPVIENVNDQINLYIDKSIIEFSNNSLGFNHATKNIIKSRNVYGFLLGEIYNTDNIKEYLETKGYIVSDCSDVELIILLYKEKGEAALHNLNGKYIILLFDLDKYEYILSNDRYGFYTFYYKKELDKIYFCSSLPLLIQKKKHLFLNGEAVNDFFNYGYLLGNKTLVDSINKLEPATILRISNKEIRENHYWDWEKIKKNNSLNYAESVDRLGYLWVKAVEKIINKHTSVKIPLSGGLDSRAIVAAIDYLGQNKKIALSYTFGTPNSLDYKIAKKIAYIARINHKLIEIDSEYWIKNWKEAVFNSVGALNLIHTHGIASKETGLDCIYLNGFIGDLVMGGSYLTSEVLSMNKEEFKSYAYQKLRDSEGLKRTSTLKSIKPFKTELPYITKKGSTDYFFIKESRVRNFTLMGTSVLGERFQDSFPFLDNDLIEFIYSLPDEWRINSKIYNDMLIKFFPKYFKEIPWQKTGYPINYNKKLIKILNLIKRVRGYANKKINKKLTMHNDNYVNYEDWMRTPHIKDSIYLLLLKGKCIELGYYDSKEILKLLEEHMNETDNHSKDIGLLLTFELLIQEFSLTLNYTS